MASRYEDKKIYKIDIDSLFSTIDICTSGFTNIDNYKKNQDNYCISFTRPPLLATHGEKVEIQLEKNNDNETIVRVVSESIIKEFDCGNNRTNVESVLHKLDKQYQSVSISSKTKRNTTVTKTISVILIIALLIGCVFIIKFCVDSSNNQEEIINCPICEGTGKVWDYQHNKGWQRCSRCNGMGKVLN